MADKFAGTQGAKRQTQQVANPRHALRRIIVENPGVSKSDIFRTFHNEMVDDQSSHDVFEEYWFDHNFRSLAELTPIATPQQRELVKVEQRQRMEQVKEIVKARAARMVFLEMTMPNGKCLADCTFKEVAKFGGWFLSLAGAGKPNEKVGKLSEAEVRKHFRGG